MRMRMNRRSLSSAVALLLLLFVLVCAFLCTACVATASAQGKTGPRGSHRTRMSATGAVSHTDPHVTSSWSPTTQSASVLYFSANQSLVCCLTAGCDTDDSAVAWALYDQQVNSTGWAFLSVRSKPGVPDLIAMRAAGMLEGCLTQPLMWDMWLTTAANFPVSDAVLKFVHTNDAWVRQQVSEFQGSDPYWQHVGLTQAQVDGMLEGYNSQAPPAQRFSVDQMMILAASADLGDISAAVTPTAERPDWLQMSADEVAAETARQQAAHWSRDHCSSLVKLTDDGSELYSGHVTWGSPQNMLRIWKTYSLPLSAPVTTAVNVSFSGYPGATVSFDDYFTTSSGLMVTETTIHNYNSSLYSLIHPEGCVLYWIRVAVANRMARSAADWHTVFARFNSGTYNNQWIVVDYALFKPGQPLPDGVLWIGEQLPAYYVSADQTQVLRFGYWPSYNIPYYESTQQLSGFPGMVAKFGNWYSYSLTARACIFRRDQHTVVDMPSFQKLMLYNDWQHDPLSYQSPMGAISGRGDLDPKHPVLHTGTDAKLTSAALMAQGRSRLYCGPTYQQQPVFTFDDWPGVVHAGTPQRFQFDWVDSRE